MCATRRAVFDVGMHMISESDRSSGNCSRDMSKSTDVGKSYSDSSVTHAPSRSAAYTLHSQ